MIKKRRSSWQEDVWMHLPGVLVVATPAVGVATTAAAVVWPQYSAKIPTALVASISSPQLLEAIEKIHDVID